MSELFTPHMTLLILAGAIATYLTRIGGYLLMSRLKDVPPRVDAALNAVPAAVLTTLVAPAFFSGGIDVTVAMAVALAIGLGFSSIPMLVGGWIAVMIMRHLVG